jgi:hypothetical protein
MVYSYSATPLRAEETTATTSAGFVFNRVLRLHVLPRQLLGSDHQRTGSHAERFGEREQQHVVGIQPPGLEGLDAPLADSGRDRELTLAQATLVTQLADRLAEESQIIGFLRALGQRNLSQIAL